MKIYHYDRVTGEYLGETDAKRDPLEKSVTYRIPANATKNAPPTTATGEVAVHNGTRWQKVPDRRGETWYDKTTGEPKTITAPGTPDSSLTSTAPPVPTPLYWEKRRELYRDRIAAFKGVPTASHVDVLGFVLDAEITARKGDATEADAIAAIVAQVKIDVPKPS